MDAKIFVENADDIVFKMEISMTLAHWKRLKRDLKDSWPSSDLSYKITDMLSQVDKVYFPNMINED